MSVRTEVLVIALNHDNDAYRAVLAR